MEKDIVDLDLSLADYSARLFFYFGKNLLITAVIHTFYNHDNLNQVWIASIAYDE